MLKLRTWKQTAKRHKAADKACGREWVCQCAACRMVRLGVGERPAAKEG